MPAKSVDQYGLAVATLGGAATQMPLKVAEEIVRKTPKAARMRFAKELAKRRGNPGYTDLDKWPFDYEYLYMKNGKLVQEKVFAPTWKKALERAKRLSKSYGHTSVNADVGPKMLYAEFDRGARRNPSPLAKAMIDGMGFAAGNAIASPLIEIGKEVVRRGFGMRKGNPIQYWLMQTKYDKKLKGKLMNFDAQYLDGYVQSEFAGQDNYAPIKVYKAHFENGVLKKDALYKTYSASDIRKMTDDYYKLENPGSLAQTNPEKSKGHIGFLGRWEYFYGADGNVYRADKSDYIQVGGPYKGYRVGSRFESTAAAWPDRWIRLQQDLFRDNPGSLLQAEQLSEQFHGRPVETELDYVETFNYDSSLMDGAELIELALESTKKGYDIPITFKRPYPRMASSSDGQQLYIVGGDQSLDDDSLAVLEKKSPIYQGHVGMDRTKRKIPLGILASIAYRTDKHHLKGASGGQDTWEHHFGEVTGIKPILVYDTLNRKMEIVGGDYQVKDVGIVN